MSSVLFLCLGNICRSPLAEGAFRALLAERGLAAAIHVDSAGTGGWHAGEAPDPRSVRHAQTRGYDLSAVRARQVHASDFHEFDLILAADEVNLRELRRRCPQELHPRLRLFLDDIALPDPYYGESDGFEKVLDLVEKQAVLLVSRWSRPN